MEKEKRYNQFLSGFGVESNGKILAVNTGLMVTLTMLSLAPSGNLANCFKDWNRPGESLTTVCDCCSLLC